MGKLSFLVGLGAGYVLGAKAGRQRYEQIKDRANQAWGHPQVQDTVEKASEQVKAKAPQVASAAGTAAQKAAGQAARATPGVSSKPEAPHTADEDLPETIHRDEKGKLHAEPGGFGPGPGNLP